MTRSTTAWWAAKVLVTRQGVDQGGLAVVDVGRDTYRMGVDSART
jgi:hypothetical protein